MPPTVFVVFAFLLGSVLALHLLCLCSTSLIAAVKETLEIYDQDFKRASIIFYLILILSPSWRQTSQELRMLSLVTLYWVSLCECIQCLKCHKSLEDCSLRVFYLQKFPMLSKLSNWSTLSSSCSLIILSTRLKGHKTLGLLCLTSKGSFK